MVPKNVDLISTNLDSQIINAIFLSSITYIGAFTLFDLIVKCSLSNNQELWLTEKMQFLLTRQVIVNFQPTILLLLKDKYSKYFQMVFANTYLDGQYSAFRSFFFGGFLLQSLTFRK